MLIFSNSTDFGGSNDTNGNSTNTNPTTSDNISTDIVNSTTAQPETTVRLYELTLKLNPCNHLICSFLNDIKTIERGKH